MGWIGWLFFGLPVNISTKKTEDDAGYGAFVVEGAALSSICKINEAIGYLLIVEVAWGDLLTEVIGGSSINARRIHDGKVWEAR